MRRPRFTLLLLGLLSCAIYAGAFTAAYPLIPLAERGSPADMGLLSGYAPAACALYVGALIALFALYLGALHLATRIQAAAGEAIVLGIGVLAALTLCFTYPYGATDLHLYIVRGRVLGLYGQNSLAVPASAFPLEPYLPFSSEWAQVPSPYGPLWEWVAALLARLGDGSLARSLLVFKGFALLSYGAALVLLKAVLAARREPAPLPKLLALAWNPLILLETHAMGHNDLFMLVWVLLALWFWERRSHAWVLVALALGGAVKYVPFLLLPLALVALWRREPARVAARAILLGGGASLVLLAALWFPLWPGWEQLSIWQQTERVHNSIAAWLILALQRLWSNVPVFDGVLWALRAAFGLAYIGLVVRAGRGHESLAQLWQGVFYLWLWLGSPAFGYWYVAWLVVLMPLLAARRQGLATLLFSATALFSMAVYDYGGEWWAGSLGIRGLHLLIVPLVFGLPPLLALWLDRRLPACKPTPVATEVASRA